jgi:uncharacterized circularly permuted ATP-grasp superfamily protein
MTAAGTPASYEPSGATVDEAFGTGGTVRPAYAGVLAAVEAASPAAIAESVAAAVQRDGVVHGADDGAHALAVDPVPRVFGAAEWDRLAAGLTQRLRALEAFVCDASGAREVFADAVVPADLLDRCPWFEDEVVELAHRGPRIGIAGPDVVRDARGELRVLEDNVRTPSLMAYAAAARRLVAPLLHGAPEPQPFEPALRAALLELAGDGAVVILGRDPGNVAWWELDALSRLTGWPLVGIDDLASRGGRVVLCADGSVVDVVWRRTNEERLRGDDGRLTALGSVLVEPLRRGSVRMVNAFGTGVADDKRTYVYVERLVRYYCGEEPLLRSVPAWDLAIDEQCAEALERLDELVVKPRDGAGGDDVVLGTRAAREELSDLRARIEADPAAWIAQEPVALSTHPTVIDGRLQPRHVDLRPFVVGGRVLPGGLSRFAQGAGELVVNCAQGGGGKDVWVLQV